MITLEQIKTLINGFLAKIPKPTTPDWDENNGFSPNYIKNRPFYKRGGRVVKYLDSEYLPSIPPEKLPVIPAAKIPSIPPDGLTFLPTEVVNLSDFSTTGAYLHASTYISTSFKELLMNRLVNRTGPPLVLLLNELAYNEWTLGEVIYSTSTGAFSIRTSHTIYVFDYSSSGDEFTVVETKTYAEKVASTSTQYVPVLSSEDTELIVTPALLGYTGRCSRFCMDVAGYPVLFTESLMCEVVLNNGINTTGDVTYQIPLNRPEFSNVNLSFNYHEEFRKSVLSVHFNPNDYYSASPINPWESCKGLDIPLVSTFVWNLKQVRVYRSDGTPLNPRFVSQNTNNLSISIYSWGKYT